LYNYKTLFPGDLNSDYHIQNNAIFEADRFVCNGRIIDNPEFTDMLIPGAGATDRCRYFFPNDMFDTETEISYHSCTGGPSGIICKIDSPCTKLLTMTTE
jgi:hypothetical protein